MAKAAELSTSQFTNALYSLDIDPNLFTRDAIECLKACHNEFLSLIASELGHESEKSNIIVVKVDLVKECLSNLGFEDICKRSEDIVVRCQADNKKIKKRTATDDDGTKHNRLMIKQKRRRHNKQKITKEMEDEQEMLLKQSAQAVIHHHQQQQQIEEKK